MTFLVLLLALQEESTLQKIDREVTSIVEKVRPSVVQVTAIFSVGGPQEMASLTLSGVVWSKDGHIVTDASGIESAAEIRVAVGSRTFKALPVAADLRTGIAVIKIEADGLSPAAVPEKPGKAGAVAIVVGNPYGMKGGASTGTVSGYGRSIQVAGRRYENMIQLTAPVNPGDCGGFVADSGGRLLGLVHSAYATDPSEAEGFSLLPLFKKNPRDTAPVAGQSVSFATHAEWVKFSADRIVKHGKMVRGWLGLSARPLDEAARAQLGLGEGVGLEVVRVEPKGPGRAAKIAVRDVIVEFDGKPVTDLDALQWRVAQVEEPVTVKVVTLRNRERREVELRIEIDPQN